MPPPPGALGVKKGGPPGKGKGGPPGKGGPQGKGGPPGKGGPGTRKGGPQGKPGKVPGIGNIISPPRIPELSTAKSLEPVIISQKSIQNTLATMNKVLATIGGQVTQLLQKQGKSAAAAAPSNDAPNNAPNAAPNNAPNNAPPSDAPPPSDVSGDSMSGGSRKKHGRHSRRHVKKSPKTFRNRRA